MTPVSCNGNPWTTFFLQLRELEEVPFLPDFGKFLITSIGFTKNLSRIKVFVKDELVLSIHKKVAPPKPMEYSKLDYSIQSANKLLSLESLEIQSIQLDVEGTFPPVNNSPEEGIPLKSISGLSSFLSSFMKPKDTSIPIIRTNESLIIKASSFMRIAVGTCKVTPSDNLVFHIERTTKKKPPLSLKIHLLWTSYDEIQSSSHQSTSPLTTTVANSIGSLFSTSITTPSMELSPTALQTKMLFSGLLTFPKQGNIFIGFPTHQTTGATCSIMSHLIPTVERESLDFVDKYLLFWNQEVLAMCGVLSRIVYEGELALMDKLFCGLGEGGNDQESLLYFFKRGSHALSSFTYGTSTPSPLVSRILNNSFFRGAKKGVRMVPFLPSTPFLQFQSPPS